jgi:pyruvate kinase
LNSKFSLKNFRRTKIIATVGPSTNSINKIYKLLDAGANGIRLNFSHGTHDEKAQQIKWIREASKDLGKPVAIIMDLQGPKIRLGDFEGTIEISKGQTFKLGLNSDYTLSGVIPTQYDLSAKLKRGHQAIFFDGKLRAIVTSVSEGIVYLRAENDSTLIRRKGINLPDTDFGGDIITAKDKADLIFASTLDIDYVAQSFIQSAKDIKELRKIISNLNMKANIIAKIETQRAIDNMEDIINETDALMIARGDLAYEVQPEAVPVYQRKLIEACIANAKPVIIATQMLYSMTSSSEPTRAEVSDIASGVISGADALMLSDETAIGTYPIEAVKYMRRIIMYSEKNLEKSEVNLVSGSSKQLAISNAVVDLASSINARAIVAETKSGATARIIASRRANIPIIAVTSSSKVAQQLAIVYLTKSYVRPIDKLAATKLTNWLAKNRVLNIGDMVVTASGKYPGVVGSTDTIKVRIIE